MAANNLLQVHGGTLNITRDQAPRAVKVNIAASCYRLTYSTAFVVSLVNLLDSWRHTSITYPYGYMDAADGDLVRNYLLTQFYFTLQHCSHILFLNNKVGFDASLINRMIDLDESVVGVVSPERRIDLKKLHAEADQPYEKAVARSLEFPVQAAENPQHKPGFVQVDRCGSEILLVSRDCITRMLQCCPELVDKNIGKYPKIARKFDTFLTPFNKIQTDSERLSEDDSFCHRWVNLCGGRIYANVDSPVQYMETLAVETRYEDLFDTDA